MRETVVSQPGDVWVMGHHRLLCGDATVQGSYEKLLGDGGAAMNVHGSALWCGLPREDQEEVNPLQCFYP